MDKIALAKRLESLSKVFAGQTPYNRDLLAMSYALSKMDDDKFKTVVSSDFEAESSTDVESCMCGKGRGPMGPMGPGPGAGKPKIIIVEDENPTAEMEEGIPVMAKENADGMFWDKRASDVIRDNLLRDVVGMNKSVCCDTGRKLEKEQVPDGSHKGVPVMGEALKKEQTPDISKSLDSGIVEKSKGKVKKEAAEKEDAEAPEKEAAEEDKSSVTPEKEATEEKKAEDEDIVTDEIKVDLDGEGDGENEENKDEESDESAEPPAVEDVTTDEDIVDSCMKQAGSSIVEGIELLASMDEAQLDAEEASTLSKLFE